MPEANPPPALMDGVVMFAAQRNQVAQIGQPTVFPLVDVVKLTPRQGPIATVPDTTAIDGPNGAPLGIGGGSMATADVDGHAPFVEHDSPDHGITGEAGHRFGRHRPTTGGLPQGICAAGSTGERVIIDHDADMGNTGAATPSTGQQLEGGPGRQVVGFGHATLVGQLSHLGVDGVADGLEPFRVELAVEVAHAGSMIDPGLPGGGIPLGFGMAQPTVSLDGLDGAPDSGGEYVDRLGRRCLHQTGGVQFPPLLGLEPLVGLGEQIDLRRPDSTLLDGPSHEVELPHDHRPIRLPPGGSTLHRSPVTQQRGVGAAAAAVGGQLLGGDADPHDQRLQAPLSGSNRPGQGIQTVGAETGRVNLRQGGRQAGKETDNIFCALQAGQTDNRTWGADAH